MSQMATSMRHRSVSIATLVLGAMAAAIPASSCAGRSSGAANASLDGSADAGIDPHALRLAYCDAYTACNLGPDSNNTLSSCIAAEENSPFAVTDATAECVARFTGDCQGVRACTDNGNRDASCEDSGGSYLVSCDGSILTVCQPNGVQQAYDCSRFKESCTPNAGCTAGSCNGTQYPYFCAGSTRMSCGQGGGYASINDRCALESATCGPGPDGGPTCVGTGSACVANRCDGATLVQCLGGREGRSDCSAVGLDCIPGDGDASGFWNGQAYCGLGAECDPTFLDSCNGTQLTYCDLGKLTTLDCVAEGWAKCLPATPPFYGGRCSL